MDCRKIKVGLDRFGFTCTHVFQTVEQLSEVWHICERALSSPYGSILPFLHLWKYIFLCPRMFETLSVSLFLYVCAVVCVWRRTWGPDPLRGTCVFSWFPSQHCPLLTLHCLPLGWLTEVHWMQWTLLCLLLSWGSSGPSQKPAISQGHLQTSTASRDFRFNLHKMLVSTCNHYISIFTCMNKHKLDSSAHLLSTGLSKAFQDTRKTGAETRKE